MPFNTLGKGEFQTDLSAASSACRRSKRRIRSAWLICTACTCFTSICTWYKSSLVAGNCPSIPEMYLERRKLRISYDCYFQALKVDHRLRRPIHYGPRPAVSFIPPSSPPRLVGRRQRVSQWLATASISIDLYNNLKPSSVASPKTKHNSVVGRLLSIRSVRTCEGRSLVVTVDCK